MDNKALKNPGGDFLPFAETAVRTLYSKKASNIRMYRLGEDSVIADCYIICTGRSGTHVRSLADALEEEFENYPLPHGCRFFLFNTTKKHTR